MIRRRENRKIEEEKAFVFYKERLSLKEVFFVVVGKKKNKKKYDALKKISFEV